MTRRSRREVVVSGFGVRSGFGFGAEPLVANVFNGIPGFRPVTGFDTSRFRTNLAASADSGLSQLSALRECARAALAMAGISSAQRGATLLAGSGDFVPVTQFWTAAHAGEHRPLSVPDLDESLPALQVQALAAECELEGPQLAFVNGCVASSNALIHGCRLISTGRHDLVVCASAYLVEQEFFAKFDSGRAFAADGRLRPFSEGRSGLLLGDAAAVLVLESEERVLRRGGSIAGRIAGWGMASDAYHVCHPHPEGVGLASAARQAVTLAGGAPIDYINAHGTATPLNDKAETAAIKNAFGSTCAIPVSSTKASTGHTLEASGALEAVISLLALEHQIVPPTGGYLGPDPDCDLDFVTTGPREQRIDRVLSLNSAFGGANTALVLSRA